MPELLLNFPITMRLNYTPRIDDNNWLELVTVFCFTSPAAGVHIFHSPIGCLNSEPDCGMSRVKASVNSSFVEVSQTIASL
jgi:hypothetical protein